MNAINRRIVRNLTKSQLETGMWCINATGYHYMVIVHLGLLVSNQGSIPLNKFNEDLTYKTESEVGSENYLAEKELDIVEVKYNKNFPSYALDFSNTTTLWKRNVYLTQQEHDFLSVLCWGYIGRDDDNALYLYDSFFGDGADSERGYIELDNTLFQFIKHTDKPHSVTDLLKYPMK